jgi:hypothetical protein
MRFEQSADGDLDKLVELGTLLGDWKTTSQAVLGVATDLQYFGAQEIIPSSRQMRQDPPSFPISLTAAHLG